MGCSGQSPSTPLFDHATDRRAMRGAGAGDSRNMRGWHQGYALLLLSAATVQADDDKQYLVQEPGEAMSPDTLKQALAKAMGFADKGALYESLGGMADELQALPPQILAGSFALTIAGVVRRGSNSRHKGTPWTVHAIGSSGEREGRAKTLELLSSMVEGADGIGEIVLVGPDWADEQHRSSVQVFNARISVFKGLYNAETVDEIGGPPDYVICFDCDIYHCHWRPSLLYLLYMRTPVYVTFFEQHEATATAELLTEGPDGAFQAFAPSQLSIKTCNDKVRKTCTLFWLRCAFCHGKRLLTYIHSLNLFQCCIRDPTSGACMAAEPHSLFIACACHVAWLVIFKDRFVAEPARSASRSPILC